MKFVFIAIILFCLYLCKSYGLGNRSGGKRLYTTPEGESYTLFKDMLRQPHLLVAGCTGSGKSVAINGLIATLLYRLPLDEEGGAQMILIDPKRVELLEYKDLPHTLYHAAGFNPGEWQKALSAAVRIMDERYTKMERKHLKMYDGGDLYVIIDEWANVYKNGGKEAYKAVMRLTSEGRAARVHVIMATQVPKANIIPSEIRENLAARLCLRTANSIQSRVIMEENGCEDLPDPEEVGYAHGYYKKGIKVKKCEIPYVQPDEIQRMLDHWHGPGVQPVK